MLIHYTAVECRDDLELLQKTLDRIGQEGAKVISVTWQPGRTLQSGFSHPGGFTIVVEEHIDA